MIKRSSPKKPGSAGSILRVIRSDRCALGGRKSVFRALLGGHDPNGSRMACRHMGLSMLDAPDAACGLDGLGLFNRRYVLSAIPRGFA